MPSQSADRPVVWTDVAALDLDRLCLYIADDDLDAAVRVASRIEESAKRLNGFAESGRIVAELKALAIDVYRELIVSPWRIVYRVAPDRVLVLSVIDGRRNVEDILLERLLGG